MISVIIPVYNAQDTLEACVESVRLQDISDIQIILVDDGSTDDSGDICEAFAQRDNRIKVIHQSNSGPSGARNAGIDIAEGEYLSFIDSDDKVEPTYLSYLLSLIHYDSRCKISQANHWIQRNGKLTCNAPDDGKITIFSRSEAAQAVLFQDKIDVSGCGKLYHRSVFDSIRYPEGRIFEDTWLFGELLKQTDTYVYGSKPQYHYVLRDGSLTRSAYTSRNLEYIEAAEKLANDLIEITPECKTGAIRKVNHARLSVLRYMEHCGKEDKEIRNQLRRQVLEDAETYLNHPQTPRRDRIAVELLKMGLPAFYLGWSLYSRFRV